MGEHKFKAGKFLQRDYPFVVEAFNVELGRRVEQQNPDPPREITVEPVETETRIDTKWGKALAAPGDYIATDSSGESYVIAEGDLEHFWQPVEAAPKKLKDRLSVGSLADTYNVERVPPGS